MNLSVYTIGTFCEFIKNELNGLYPEREIHSLSDMIIFHVLGIPKHEIHLEKEKAVNDEQNLRIAEIVRELKLFKPIQYIFGYADFYGLKIHVTPDVLIPRPETEELVRWIIDDNKDTSPEILDIGTGSGCIAIALKKNMPRSVVYACDFSESALSVAEENAAFHNLDIVFFNKDVTNHSISPHLHLSSLSASTENHNPQQLSLYDVIVSNPPYISIKEKSTIGRNISGFEPDGALFVPDNDPFIFYRNIAYFGLDHLKTNGLLYFEIHENSGREISLLLEKAGYRDIVLRRDINDKNRMIKCIKQ